MIYSLVVIYTRLIRDLIAMLDHPCDFSAINSKRIRYTFLHGEKISAMLNRNSGLCKIEPSTVCTVYVRFIRWFLWLASPARPCKMARVSV